MENKLGVHVAARHVPIWWQTPVGVPVTVAPAFLFCSHSSDFPRMQHHTTVLMKNVISVVGVFYPHWNCRQPKEMRPVYIAMGLWRSCPFAVR